MGHIENDATKNVSIVARVFVTAVTFLLSRCLATIGWFLPSRFLATIRGFLTSCCLTTIGGYTDTHTQQRDLISLRYFLNKESRLKVRILVKTETVKQVKIRVRILIMASTIFWYAEHLFRWNFKDVLAKQNLTSDSCWILAWLILRPWSCSRYVPPKRRLTFYGLHGVISQKIVLFNRRFCCTFTFFIWGVFKYW
jgi:hypothetical protein